MRAALYARFSSDQQRQTSIEDQLRQARARAAAEGWEVVAERSDSAVSGATPFALRPGSKALLADALASRFDVLLVESLDRTFRNLADQETTIKRLEHRGIRIVGIQDNYDSSQGKHGKVARVVRGLFAETYLDDLADKTRRGMSGQFERGLSAGGQSYGYRTEDAGNGRRMVIQATEAEHVRWIFERYADGWSPVAIAHELNRQGVPAPRGGTWSVSAIHGSAARGLGLLNNALYAGRVIWNRRQWLKDPETGARRYVERPRSEWMEREAPELRIVAEPIWQATRRRMDVRIVRGAKTAAAQRGTRSPRTLFGGMMVCPTCGGPIIAVDARRYGCSVHKDRGPAACAGDLTIPRQTLDTRLLAKIRDDMPQDEALAAMQQRVRAAIVEQLRRDGSASEDGRRRLAEIGEELGRLVDAMTRHGYSSVLGDRLRALEAERAELEKTAGPAQVLDADEMAATAVARYKAAMLDLRERLLKSPDMERTREVLRQLVGPVRVMRDANGVTWAQMQNRAEQLLVAGAAASISGCGGPQLDLEASAGWVRICG